MYRALATIQALCERDDEVIAPTLTAGFIAWGHGHYDGCDDPAPARSPKLESRST